MQLHSRPFQVVIFCLALLPAFLTIWVILNYGVDVPYWDDWETAVLIDKFSQGALSPAHLFAKHNEYRQFFPNLIFVLLAWLTRWDLRYQMLVSFLMACVVSFNIYRLGQLTAGSESRRLIQFFLSNLLIFSPMQYENWLMGIQVVYFVPILCITICLRIACSRLSDKSKFITCAFLSTVSTFSSVNGILCWVVALPVLLRCRLQPLKKKTWAVFAWVAGTATSATFYSYGAERIALGSSLSDQPLVQLGRALVHFLAFLGGSLAIGRQPLFIAVSAGAVLLALFVLSWKFFLKHSTDNTLAHRLIVWLMLGTYSVLNGAMVTAGRIHYGVEQSLSSRYTTFSLYLIVSLVYLVPIILEGAPGILKSGKREASRRLATLAAILLVVVHLVAFPLIIQRGVKPMFRQRLYTKACLVLINVMDDDCGAVLYPNIEELRQRASSIDRLGFLRPPLVKSDRVKDIEAEAGNPEVFGSFDSLDNAGEDKRIASGWATLPGAKRPPDGVILAYENTNSDFIVFALAEVEIEKWSSLDLFRPAAGSRWRWQKSFPLSRLPTFPTKLNAWAFDAKTGRAYKLRGEKIVE